MSERSWWVFVVLWSAAWAACWSVVLYGVAVVLGSG